MTTPPVWQSLVTLACLSNVFLILNLGSSAAVEDWTILTPLPDFSSGAQSILLFDKIVFFHENIGLLYDIDLDAWTSISSPPHTRKRHGVAAVANTKAITIAGETPGATAVSTVEIFSSATLSWTTVNALPTARSSLACAGDRLGMVYCTGGYLTAATTNTWKYTRSTGVWLEVRSLPTARSAAGAGHLDGPSGGYVLVVGGDPSTAQAELYTTLTDVWTTVSASPTLKGNIISLPCFGSFCYAIGGSSIPKGTHQYSKESNAWTTLASSPTDHDGHAAVMRSNGFVYVIGHAPSTGSLERLQTQPLGLSPWTAVSPIPAYNQASTYSGQAAAYSTKVVVTHTNEAHVFDEALDAWTTISPGPISAITNAGSAPYPGGIAFVGGVITGTYYASLFTLDLDGYVWTERTTMPSLRAYLAADGDNAFIWAVGGYKLPGGSRNTVEEYNVALDAWTSRNSLPANNHRCNAAYWANHIVIIGGTASEKWRCYSLNIPSDSWTTCAAPPIDYYDTHDVLVARENQFFISGGSQYNKRALHRFQLDSDTWTTLVPSPYPHEYAMGVLTDSGRYYLIGGPASLDSTVVSVYSTGLIGGSLISGDPVFTTIFGSVYKLSLRPGLFNLLSTPSVTVNAVVETLASFPAEENTFLTMIGIVSKRNDSLTTIYLSTSSDAESPYLEIVSDDSNWENIVSVCPGKATFHLPGLEFTVYTIRVAIISSDANGDPSSLHTSGSEPSHPSEPSRASLHTGDSEPSRVSLHANESEPSRSSLHTSDSEPSRRFPQGYLDVHVTVGAPEGACGGLLGDLNRNPTSVLPSLVTNHYEVANGCLFGGSLASLAVCDIDYSEVGC